MEPLKKFPLRFKLVRFGNAEKSRGSRVPRRLARGRSMAEMEPAALQRMPRHWQRVVVVVEDHELRSGDGERVVFHLSRASASVVDGEDVALKGDDERREKQRRRRYVFISGFYSWGSEGKVMGFEKCFWYGREFIGGGDEKKILEKVTMLNAFDNLNLRFY